jgi:hypothetical protein
MPQSRDSVLQRQCFDKGGAAMKPRIRLLAVFSSLSVPSILGGCFFFIGDPVPGTAIQAYAPKQTREEAARTVDEAMAAAGLKGAGGWQTVSPGVSSEKEMATYFMMPDKRTALSATIEGRPHGARVCVRITGPMGKDELEPNAKAGVARLRAALIERFGEAYVTATPCSQEPYWPGANVP